MAEITKILNYWCVYIHATGWIYYCLFCAVQLCSLHNEFRPKAEWGCCFTVLKYRHSALKEAISPGCLMLFPPVPYGSLLYMSQLYVNSREADRLSSMSILLGAYTGCNVLYSRHSVGTCVYTALCLRVILDAECEEAQLGHAITQLASPPSFLSPASFS